MTKFFSSFQGFWNDDEKGAAISYEKLSNTYRNRLKKGLSNGEGNEYYSQIDGWINCIIDEIDDWFQHPCRLDLTHPEGETMEYFSVDPEIG